MNSVVPRERLAAVLGMLGSEHDGEALNAARLAERMRKAAGVSWSDLLFNTTSTADPSVSDPPAWQGPRWRVLMDECRRRPELLTAWEDRFLASIARRSNLSRKQLSVLEAIAAKAGDH